MPANPGNHPIDAEQSGDSHQYLTFNLSNETFALGILAIKEIIEYSEPTAVPMMPDYLRGVINLRGRVVPVIDLARRLGKSPAVVGKRTCIVIVEIEFESERHDVGVVVDCVNAVLEIPSEDIEPPPSFGMRIRSEFIAGMGKISGKFVMVIATHQLLASSEMEALTGGAAEHSEVA